MGRSGLPSSAGAGVDSFGFSAAFGFAFALANDLKMSDFSLFRLGLESAFLNVGADRPDVVFSEAFPPFS